MARKTLPAHLRKSGPGTGGRNVERDRQICALKATGLSNEGVGKQFGLSRERVRNVLDAAERDAKAGRTRWMSAPERRAENAKRRAGL
jgi:transposase